MECTETKKLTHAERGRLGGKATVAKHGKEHMSAIGQRGFNSLADRVGSPYAVVRFLQNGGKWEYMDGKKIGGDHYAQYHARGR